MAKLKSIKSKPFLSELYQVFNFNSPEELEKKRASLFPIGKSTDENQTTSIFLASLSAVKEYREELFNQIGIKKINNRNMQLHVYTEIPCNGGDDRPDGLIVLTSGINNPVIEWVSFVESKIGNNDIDSEQIARYIKYGKEIGIENIITISNQLVTTPYESPASVNKRIKCNLFHWSWIYLSVTGGRLLKAGVIEDSDHVYILSELRRYFKMHKGLKNYEGMEKSWNEATTHFLERSTKPLINEIIKSYKQEEKDICLQLIEATGYHINLKTNKKPREEVLEKMLEKNRIISSTFFVSDNPSQTFTIDINFHSRTLACYTHYSIDTGKAKAQTTKMINIVSAGDVALEEEILIGAIYPRMARSHIEFKSLAVLLQEKEDGSYSIVNKERGDTIKEFEIKITDDLGRDFHRPQVIVTRLENLAKIFFEKVFIRLK
ncbi:MAG: hypothetical protein P794_00535 [Epsilonproteobacteria bacterium (ex Lamellibrachia satsuma)]|nr:MAG: hypothetical protein P794_00535 [Epsilonproteobacteria bacterium (ex Lamellibrachia satsuma)]